MKTQKYQLNYGAEKRNVQLKTDEIYVEKVIPAEDSVRLLDEIIEGMDYTVLMRAYKRTGRRPATNPVTKLKILVYANMEGLHFKPRHCLIMQTGHQLHLAAERC